MFKNLKFLHTYITAANLATDLKKRLTSAGSYLFTFFKWSVIAIVTGAAGGLVGGAFHKSVVFAASLREQNKWLIFFLPVGGVVIALLYHLAKLKDDPGTNLILRSVQSDERIPFKIAPLIFIGTVITQLCGGSAGREGAALQLGGSIGAVSGKIFRLDKSDRRIAVLCGMSGVFSALFGTPLTATLFAMEVISVGIIFYISLVPCILSSLVAYGLSCYCMGNEAVRFSLKNVPGLSVLSVIQIIALGALCAFVSILFCIVMEKTSHYAKKWLPNPYLRAVAGGSLVLLLTLLLGTQTYNGTGMDYITRIIGGDHAQWYDFLLKLLFTAVSIAAGFKGGEIVPTFFVGTAFGCFAGNLLGLDPSFGAAIGMVALFCGVVNCPIASFVLSIEVFGAQGLLLFAPACCVSYMLSGYYGLYSSQKIMHSKLKAEYMNPDTK